MPGNIDPCEYLKGNPRKGWPDRVMVRFLERIIKIGQENRNLIVLVCSVHRNILDHLVPTFPINLTIVLFQIFKGPNFILQMIRQRRPKPINQRNDFLAIILFLLRSQRINMRLKFLQPRIKSMMLLYILLHEAFNTNTFLKRREEVFLFITMMLVNKYDQSMDEGREISSVFFRLDVPCLQINAIQDTDEYVVN